MKIVKAKLIKHKTDDGLMEMQEDIPLGKIYLIDSDSLQNVQAYNMEKHVRHEKMMVNDITNDAYLPMELLELIDIEHH